MATREETQREVARLLACILVIATNGNKQLAADWFSELTEKCLAAVHIARVDKFLKFWHEECVLRKWHVSDKPGKGRHPTIPDSIIEQHAHWVLRKHFSNGKGRYFHSVQDVSKRAVTPCCSSPPLLHSPTPYLH